MTENVNIVHKLRNGIIIIGCLELAYLFVLNFILSFKSPEIYSLAASSLPIILIFGAIKVFLTLQFLLIIFFFENNKFLMEMSRKIGIS